MDDAAGVAEVEVVVVVLNTGVEDDSKSNDSFNGSNFGAGERSSGTDGVVVDSFVFLRDLYMLLNFNNPITERKVSKSERKGKGNKQRKKHQCRETYPSLFSNRGEPSPDCRDLLYLYHHAKEYTFPLLHPLVPGILVIDLLSFLTCNILREIVMDQT